MKLPEDLTRWERILMFASVALLAASTIATVAFLVLAGLLYMLIPASD